MDLTSHLFNVQIAKEYGVNQAIILNNLVYWIKYNKENNKNFHKGTYWVYTTYDSLHKIHPYFTARQVRYSIKKLIDCGVIISDRFNKEDYDKTNWYALTKKGCELYGMSHGQNCQTPSDKIVRPPDKIVRPIPYIEEDIEEVDISKENIIKEISVSKDDKPDDTKPTLKEKKGIVVNDKKEKQTKRKKFVPPTLAEVEAYVIEKNYNVDAKHFIEYYEASDWHMNNGKKMRSWKQSLVTWNRNNLMRKSQPSKQAINFEENANADYKLKLDKMKYNDIKADLAFVTPSNKLRIKNWTGVEDISNDIEFIKDYCKTHTVVFAFDYKGF